ncbi:hypothetical protein PMAC_000743 [Pneumocystis sp. 'macacae']|nr:hypothetical protein PMAC_000743 [Pneumocystis sp. 'macacae']
MRMFWRSVWGQEAGLVELSLGDVAGTAIEEELYLVDFCVDVLHELDDEVDDLVLEHGVGVLVCDEEGYVVSLETVGVGEGFGTGHEEAGEFVGEDVFYVVGLLDADADTGAVWVSGVEGGGTKTDLLMLDSMRTCSFSLREISNGLRIVSKEDLEIQKILGLSLYFWKRLGMINLWQGKKKIKDESILSEFNIKPYTTIMLIGSAETPSEVLHEQPVFLEDMDESQLVETLSTPSGLTNLGNTCYMNSTLQMLKCMPELREELEKILQDKTWKLDKSGVIIESLADVFRNMNTQKSFSPYIFLGCLRLAFPQFAEKDRVHGGFSQQDAEECWSQLIQNLRTHMPKNENSLSFVEKYMLGTVINEIRCNETQGEPPITFKEEFIKLNCHIGMNTNYMIDGLKEGLKEIISKRSEVLNREATFTKISRLSRLPKYLTINFVRFFWKLSIRKKVKILRKVKFPLELDICELCADELKSRLIPVRDVLRNINKNIEERNTRKKVKTQLEDNTDDDLEKFLNEMIKELWNLVDPKSIDDGSNVSGLYNLIGILTHSGASADSGHYQAWIKIPDSSDWYQFNDDDVTIVPRSKIETLDGGGENDTAYIALYSAMALPNAI